MSGTRRRSSWLPRDVAEHLISQPKLHRLLKLAMLVHTYQVNDDRKFSWSMQWMAASVGLSEGATRRLCPLLASEMVRIGRDFAREDGAFTGVEQRLERDRYVKIPIDPRALRNIPSSTVAVLLAVLLHAHKTEHGFRTAWPSVGTMGEVTGLGRRAVQMALRRLHSMDGIFSVIRRKTNTGRDTSNQYVESSNAMKILEDIEIEAWGRAFHAPSPRISCALPPRISCALPENTFAEDPRLGLELPREAEETPLTTERKEEPREELPAGAGAPDPLTLASRKAAANAPKVAVLGTRKKLVTVHHEWVMGGRDLAALTGEVLVGRFFTGWMNRQGSPYPSRVNLTEAIANAQQLLDEGIAPRDLLVDVAVRISDPDIFYPGLRNPANIFGDGWERAHTSVMDLDRKNKGRKLAAKRQAAKVQGGTGRRAS